MSRRDPLYSLINFAVDTIGRSIVKEISKKNSERYLPTVRGDPIKENIGSLIKVDRPEVYFDRDIGGLEKVKEDLRLAVVYPRTRRDLYFLYDKPIGNVLLYGPPGCGKTLLAKAVATECGWPFISPYISDIMKGGVRYRERIVSYLFEYCRSLWENSVLFIDEMEQLTLRNGPPYVQRIKDEFQIQMDGINSKKGFPVLIGASNKPWLIDTSIRRPGRFDKLIFVPPPDFYERKQILRISLSRLLFKNMIEDDFEALVSNLAEQTESFSGADLVSLVDSAKEKPLLEAVRGERVRRIRKEDFEDVLKTKKPSTNSWFSEAIRSCRRYEEKDLLEEILKFAHYLK